ncbi:MAG: hypothetical protein KN64_01840 [Sulfurovum sp. AS07-7]|nr:MAG: hypothetical protein KN64_01840 [Sulfurovum sp. AS07-7]
MKITINGEERTLQKRQRAVGSEAPAVKLKLKSGEDKVIGMMANKIQLICMLSHEPSDELVEIINANEEKVLSYIVSCVSFDTKNLDDEKCSFDFYNLAMKFGVCVDETLCADSIFLIDKEGMIVYKEIITEENRNFDLEGFKKALDEAVNFKRKGHVHENWMRY